MNSTNSNQPQFNELLKSMFSSAFKLSLFVFISIVLLLAVRHITAPYIAQAEKVALLNSFNQVLPTKLYNNEPLTDTLQIANPEWLDLLGTNHPVTLYRARLDNQPAGLIFTTVAPNGYNGNITLLVGILPDGQLSGVRVLNHKETPGLGDKIEIYKDNWILDFNGRSLHESNLTHWAVKKDGGDFDQLTGATITPRAVIKAVKKALQLTNTHGATFYE